MIIMLAGPIKHWWDENWDTPEHWDYVYWRVAVSNTLVREGHLVYRPHEAFKGAWDERAQKVNDAAIVTCDLMINLSPPGVPSEGTDAEVLFCEVSGRRVINAPPPTDLTFEPAIDKLLAEL